MNIRGGVRNLPTEVLELPTRVYNAKTAKKRSFHRAFWQISSDKNPKCSPTEGLDASNDRGASPLQPSPGTTTECSKH